MEKNTALAIGIGIIGIFLLLAIIFVVGLSSGTDFFKKSPIADAILFIDISGRIALNQNLQVTGPAPVPVSAGDHELTLFDQATTYSPLAVSVASGEFKYVSDPAQPRSYIANTNRGAVSASAFPPDTTIEIPDCTPTDATRPVTCKSQHTLTASLSAGTYRVNFTNPNFPSYSEDVTVTADGIVRLQHSFITTVEEWDVWRSQHGQIIERTYGKSVRRRGSGGALLLPFAVTADIVDELF